MTLWVSKMGRAGSKSQKMRVLGFGQNGWLDEVDGVGRPRPNVRGELKYVWADFRSIR